MSIHYKASINGDFSPLPHFWEHTIGSGHATLALRADWQAQLKKAHEELGVRHVRFHGILDDDIGTLVAEGDQFFYSFFNTDCIFDFLLSVGMKPFVELSFMPTALASGVLTAFHYKANVTPPKDPSQWSTLIRKLVQHWVERYGMEEVRQWYFEVWNEPNLQNFWDGKIDDYLKLYEHTARAIKAVDKDLKVGGPATAKNAWIPEFLEHTKSSGIPVDFVSTHHYPTDAFGKASDDTVGQLAASHRGVMRDEARVARKQAGDKPLYYTEWCTSSNPRDPLHDDPYAAAFIVKTILEANGLVDGYSYWTFSDIFEENYMPSKPFQGGFGLLNIHGIPKPSYRSFQLLHKLGHEIKSLSGSSKTVDGWLCKANDRVSVVFTNFALPEHPIKAVDIELELSDIPSVGELSIQRIDAEHGNPKQLWQKMGEPEYLSRDMVEELQAASALAREPLPVRFHEGKLSLTCCLPPQSVALIEVVF